MLNPGTMGTPPLAKRLQAVKPSATVAITDRARQLKADGMDVISFSVGEPDFETPAHVQEAAMESIRAGKSSHYTAARGIPELRAAICDDSARRRGGNRHQPNEVVVSVGAKHTLFNLALALYDDGDEIIVPAPYWVSYPEQAALLGARAVIVETRQSEGFRVTPEALRGAVTPKTKALVLCSPSNPTGAAYAREHLAELAEVIRDGSYWVIVDEMYSELVYGGFDQRSILEIAPDLRDRLIIVDGVSKTYAMTGWRIGWMLSPAHVASACDMIQGQSTTNPTAAAQWAAVAALTGPREPIEAMRKAFEERRAVIVEGMNEIPGFDCRMPEGAFYAFPSVHGVVGRRADGVALADDVAVCTYLLEKAGVALVPGTAFGAPGFLRMSYATSVEVIREGLRRIREAISRLD
jgi:aspartate aminotransferase